MTNLREEVDDDGNNSSVNTGGAVGVLISFGVYTAFFLFVIASLYKRRASQPLKFRGPVLLFLSAVGGYVSVAVQAMYLFAQFYPAWNDDIDFCGSIQWLVWWSAPTFFLPYVLRGYRVIRIFRLLDPHPFRGDDGELFQRVPFQTLSEPVYEQDEDAEQDLIRLGSHQAPVPLSFTLTQSRLLFYYCVLIGLILLAKGIFIWSGDPVKYAGYGCPGTEIIWLVSDFFEFSLLFYSMYRLRRVYGEHGIGDELAAICFVWIATGVGLAIALVAKLANGTSDETYLKVHASLTIGRNFCALIFSVGFPVMQSYHPRPYNQFWSTADSLRSLKGVLRDLVCIKYFRMFLMERKKQACLHCWLQIELYEDSPQESLQSEAARLYEICLGNEAEEGYRVFVSEHARQAVSQQLAVGATSHTFDVVREELYQQMNSDFTNFVTSGLGQECFYELERQEQIKSILEKSGMIDAQSYINVQ